MLKRLHKKIFFLISISFLPIFAYAQLGGTDSILVAIKDIVTEILVPLVFTLALLFFFYGVAKYIWSAGSDKDEGKKIMIWGVIALFVMTSVWGLVYFIRDELNISDTSSGKIPTIGP